MSEAEDGDKAFDTSQIDTATVSLKGIDRAVRIDFGKACAHTEVRERG
jgi:hypothetical protein